MRKGSVLRHVVSALFVLAALLLLSTKVLATPLLPGATVVPGAITLLGDTLLADTGIQNLTSSTPNDWTATLQAQVYRNSGGTLDFVYQFHNNANSSTALGRVTGSNFGASFTTDVFFDTTDTLSLGATTAGLLPSSADRGTCPSCLVVGFTFNTSPTKVLPGETTPILLVRTNATDFTTGFASLINSGVGAGSAFEPVVSAVPEPGTLLLLGTGLVMLTGVARRWWQHE